MTEYDLMKLFSRFEEAELADFTPEELEEFYRAVEASDVPLSPADWKAKYFEYYDDVKDKSLKKQDW